jgi:glutamyl-tRNA reductase
MEQELNRILRKVKNGMDPNAAAEELAHRIKNKILHNIVVNLKTPQEFDIETGRKEYEKNYINKYKKTADHMNDVEY